MIEQTMTDQADFLAACRDLLGDTYVLTLDADMAPFLTDWRDRFTGKALAVLRPATVDEVAGALRRDVADQRQRTQVGAAGVEDRVRTWVSPSRSRQAARKSAWLLIVCSIIF